MKPNNLACGLGLILAAVAVSAADAKFAWPGETLDTWRGYTRHGFKVDGCTAWVVEPKQPMRGNPWTWCLEFPDAFTERTGVPDLLAKGFFHVHIQVGNTFGCPAALKHFDAFYQAITEKGLAKKGTLIGISRGGLYAYNWAAQNPDKVACLYGDAPVCDFKSWPGGKGQGKGSPTDWKAMIKCYEFKDEAEALAWNKNPIDNLAALAKAKIPLIHVVGDVDDVVPAVENTAIIETRYKELGGEMKVFHKPNVGHHPHGLDNPQPLVDLILQYTATTMNTSLKLTTRRLAPMAEDKNRFNSVEAAVEWEPRHTAVVICDMWDQHWCKGATARVAEMAPRMNEVVSELRRRGVFIIHCPSGTMKYYEGTPQRQLAQAAPKVTPKVPLQGWCNLDKTREAPLPIDDADGGCDDNPKCTTGNPWRRQIATIEIKEGDAITDSAEAYYLMRQRGITNVIVMGVHENMCVLGRPFSIRQMVNQDQNVVLMRDLTDTMYNSRSKPLVDHFTGTDLVAWHIEKYWCPTVTSDQVIGGKPFRFAADTKPPRVYANPK